MIPLELPEEDFQKFQQFCKFYDTFSVMVESGVFRLRHQSAVLMFDGHGVLISIRKVEAPKGEDLYRRKKQTGQNPLSRPK